MRINIASSGGRFHLLDLARELSKCGHEVHFYSFVPDKRAAQFGLKKECNNNYFWVAAPFLALFRIFHRALWTELLYNRFFDRYVALVMKPCDVFIGHSPTHVHSIKYAKKKYGAVTIIERGTSHVKTQLKVLQSNPAAKGKRVKLDGDVRRDLAGYDVADYISIASRHVYESFIENGVSKEKLFVNPYGVDLANFGPTSLDTAGDVYDVIMTGHWCYRKGCDLLYQACKEMGLRLLHVGGLGDVPFVETDKMKHHDAVDEKALKGYYARARVFALPSREEGLAMVQPQAMICGLPLVCSHFSGGADLREMLDDKKWVIEMRELTVAELKRCIAEALKLAATQRGERNYVGNAMSSLTWEGYGKRYDKFLRSIVK